MNHELRTMTCGDSATTLPDCFAPHKIPQQAAEVICQLLHASEDVALQQLAKDISRTHTFTLAADDGGETGDALINALTQHRHPGTKRELPNPAHYAQLDPEGVAAWFRPHGEFQRAMPDYEYRAEQYEMAAAVAESFGTQRHLIVEAGTGVGKTMAYLVPSVLWTLANKIPVVISTNTKNLQEQIYAKDLPAIARIIRTPFKTAIIKGRANYLCLHRLAHLLANRETDIPEAQLLRTARACAWIFTTKTGDLAELDGMGDNQSGTAVARLFSTPEECGGRACRYYSRCFLQHARGCSLEADIIITNHSVFFSEPDGNPLALPKHAQVVFDEAHNLEEAATRKFQRDVSPLTFHALLRKLHHATRRTERGFLPTLRRTLLANNFLNTAEARDAAFKALDAGTRHTDSIKRSAQKFLRKLTDLPHPDENVLRLRNGFDKAAAWQSLTPHLHALQDDLFALTKELEAVYFLLANLPDEQKSQPVGTAPAASSPAPQAAQSGSTATPADIERELGLLRALVKEVADDLEFITAAKDKDWVYWVSIGRDFDRKPVGSLHAAPVDIAKFMAETIFKTKETVVLCSATMNVDNSPRYIAHRIGLDLVDPDRVMAHSAGSPFDYTRQCLAAAPVFLGNPADAGDVASAKYTRDFADLALKLVDLARGRTLILFTSYRMMTDTATMMQPALDARGIRLLVQGAGLSRERITDLFKQDAPSVLFGTDSFWEGVDLIGEALSCLIIAKLPFDAVNDPVVSARAERVAEEGGSSFRDFSLPNAVIKFRQGFGRLIRHNNDRGVVVVTDPRVFTKNYGLIFRRNIPARITQYDREDKLLADIATFFANPTHLLTNGNA